MQHLLGIVLFTVLVLAGCDAGGEPTSVGSVPATRPAPQDDPQPEPVAAASRPATQAVAGDAGPVEEESGPHFARARELYKGVPETADEVLAELELELRDHPGNYKALMLKATTQAGLERYDAALATLEQLSAVAPETVAMFNPRVVHLRARCLYEKGEYEAAKKALAPFWAFFQGNADNEARYESLMSAIDAKLPAEEAEGRP